MRLSRLIVYWTRLNFEGTIGTIPRENLAPTKRSNKDSLTTLLVELSIGADSVQLSSRPPVLFESRQNPTANLHYKSGSCICHVGYDVLK